MGGVPSSAVRAQATELVVERDRRHVSVRGWMGWKVDEREARGMVLGCGDSETRGSGMVATSRRGGDLADGVDSAAASSDLVLDRMRPEDLEEVLDLERRCFPYPWTERMFREEFGHPWAFLEVLREASSGRIVGYVDYWVLPSEVHLMSLAVLPEWRRRGLGGFLLRRVVEAARRADVPLVVLEVRVSNEPARRLYEKHGFRVNRTRRGYYADSGEDALEMIYQVPREDDD